MISDLRKLLKHAERDLKWSLDATEGVAFTDFMRECLIEDIGNVRDRINQIESMLTDGEQS